MPVKEKKDDKELLRDIRDLLILIASKPKASQKEVGKCLGVGETQINNILMGVGRKKSRRKNER